MKSTFPTYKLNDLSQSIIYGHTASAIKEYSGVKFLRITDIQKGAVNWDSVPYCECSKKDIEKYSLQRGDIVFARTGATTGKSYLIKSSPKKTVFASYLIRVRPNDKVDPKFLARFFETPNYWNQIQAKSSGATLPGVNATKLKELKLPLPTLPEQKRIATILDKADAIRCKRQQAIKLADDFLRTTFLDMFGDPKRNNLKTQTIELGEISQILMGQSPKGDSYNTNGKGAPLLNGPAEFGRKYPKERQWTTEPKKYAAPGDILFCVRGATAGRLNWADKGYCIGRGLAAIRPREKISGEFIYKFLEFMYQYFQESSDGSTFINIPSNVLKTLPVPNPSEIEEKQFTSIAKAIEILRTRNETSFKESEDCFNALTQRAFRGEL